MHNHYHTTTAEKETKMKTTFTTNDRDHAVAKEAVEVSRGSRLADFKDMSVRETPDGLTFIVPELVLRTPVALNGLRIELVTIETLTQTSHPKEGVYRRGQTTAVVEHFYVDSWLKSKIAVRGRTLKATLKLFNDIRTGNIEPVSAWVTLR